MTRPARQDVIRALIAATALALVWATGSGRWSPDAYWRVVNAMDDWRIRTAASAAPSPQVAIVDIDERSLAAVGPWPWPRAVHAQILSALFEQDAAVVGLDIVFPDVESAPDGDQAILDLARAHPLVFAQAFDFSAAERASSTGHLSGAMHDREGEPARRLVQAPAANGYVANFFEPGSERCVGHITPRADADGTVRAIAPFIRHEGSVYPMLALQMLRCAAGGKDLDIASLAATLPRARGEGIAAIPFHRSPAGFEVIPALDLLTGKASREQIAGRHVLVGSSAMGLSDRISTPVDPWLPGVVVHAELLDWLLAEQSRGGEARPAIGWIAYAWAVLSVLLFASVFRRNAAWVALTVLALSTAIWFAVALLASRAGLALRIDPPLLVAAIFLLAQAPFEWISAQRRARAFEQRFGSYLPPLVLKGILERGDTNAFDPRRHEVTVLFVDIAGYTAMAESIEPEALVSITDRILSRLTECVYATDGTLDKYIGDALMAFWGAPVAMPDHADRAVDCARAMLRSMDALNEELLGKFPQLAGRGPIRIRVALNSGEAVVGEIGSRARRSYTALGDCVNIAARLLDYAKEVAQVLLIGQSTARRCRRQLTVPIGSTVLRGRTQPEQVYVLPEFACPQTQGIASPAASVAPETVDIG
ncbi:CHASE2 domain-containing protein [Paracidovorax citrulli]